MSKKDNGLTPQEIARMKLSLERYLQSITHEVSQIVAIVEAGMKADDLSGFDLAAFMIASSLVAAGPCALVTTIAEQIEEMALEDAARRNNESQKHKEHEFEKQKENPN